MKTQWHLKRLKLSTFKIGKANRFLKLVVAFIISLLIVTSSNLTAFSQSPTVSASTYKQTDSSTITDGAKLIELGLVQYRNQQYAASIDSWQLAVQELQQTGDRFGFRGDRSFC